MIGITTGIICERVFFKFFRKVYFYMKKNQFYRKFFKLRKHAEKGQYILNLGESKSCLIIKIPTN